MGEFSDDDDDFASFDLDAAMASANTYHENTKQNNQPSPSSAQNSHPNMASASPTKTTTTAAGQTKRPPSFSPNNVDNYNSKKLKTAEGGDNDDAAALMLANELSTIPDQFKSAMTNTLQHHFGLSTFRPGQLTVLHSLLGDGMNGGGKDTCVFWATGAGKSLCYQLPPLYLNQVAIVVSPLISLMEDQVAKLNGRSGADIATFLGSSQSDHGAEARALNGEFRLVYVTPEKLTGGGFLNQLANMHQNGGSGTICLIAVDESHCVSEWGHDFRKSFLDIGPSLRNHSALMSIPLLALTATAVPRVQQDIIKNLRMQPDTTIAKKSFDRTNLKIAIRRKPRNGPLGAFEKMAKEMAKAIVQQGITGNSTSKGIISGKSTIVYCSTKKEVEDICSKITQSLAHQLVQRRSALSSTNSSPPITLEAASQLASSFIKPYHAGLSFGHRTDAHTEFLIGKVTVIVATVAFGMGIDKPDIRRVIHWGACKTVEEYYQQMGRAGRDGLNAECIMYADTHDFVKYKDDFYLGGLSGEARAATERSMDALKNFAMSSEGCRRASLLKFFDETPSFGKFCGTCDLCLNRKNHGEDFERDFQWEGARVILFAVMACPNQSMTTLETIFKGGTVAESYKYHPDLRFDPSRVTRKVASLQEKMKRKKPSGYFKELVPSLVSSGHLSQSTKKNSSHQYARPYSVYGLTPKGHEVLSGGPIVLPVPTSVREQEKHEEEKKRQIIAELKSKGVDLQQIPQEELEAGDGESIAALKRWYSYVDSLAARGRTDSVNQMDDLKNRIDAWRMDMAERYRMAPASVMEEHLLVKIAYATASLRAGTRMDEEALVAAGVRSNGLTELTTVLCEWADESLKVASENGANDHDDDLPMYFTPGQDFQPANSWRFAVYKPNKKTGKAVWEVSYDRFMTGTHPQTIAMTQKSGKPIQVATVVGHILEALVQGRAVDLHRLASVEPPPRKCEWLELVRCSVETDIVVSDDPATSGPDGERFTMKDFLVPVMGNSFALKDYKERTPEESAKFSK
ncbi:hypothetical protein ACHAXR_009382, partial [Thalassiosira sp. AJA248-18]